MTIWDKLTQKLKTFEDATAREKEILGMLALILDSQLTDHVAVEL